MNDLSYLVQHGNIDGAIERLVNSATETSIIRAFDTGFDAVEESYGGLSDWDIKRALDQYNEPQSKYSRILYD